MGRREYSNGSLNSKTWPIWLISSMVYIICISWIYGYAITNLDETTEIWGATFETRWTLGALATLFWLFFSFLLTSRFKKRMN